MNFEAGWRKSRVAIGDQGKELEDFKCSEGISRLGELDSVFLFF